MPGPTTFARAVAGPPTCKGQRTTKNYGDITVTLKTKGGFLHPSVRGFGGSMPYPGVERSVKLTLRNQHGKHLQ